MKRIIAGLLLLSGTLAAWSADEPKPQHNHLGSGEIAEGWILLFDGETTFGWQSPNGSKWTVYEGTLAPQAEKQGLLVTTTAFNDYELKFEAMSRERGSQNTVLMGCNADGTFKGRQLPANHRLIFGGNWFEYTIRFEKGSITGVSQVSKGSGFNAFGGATKSPQFFGKEVKVAPGHIALSGNGMIFRSIKLRPLDTQTIFNSRDLTGWKEHPDKKSKFTVTPEGWLNIKDGPGDLQTNRKWDNFLLQLECISNGQHLNSGVFFRCRPGEYQQGYEAQIHNGFLDEAAKEYTIEEYDPASNELKEKKKIKSPALDYGTGGIYRRMPVRKAMSRDNQWFGMTVVANGRHLSTWVNGIQVVDWTDNRPLKDNARNGCRLEAGPISLQGHDPTTDLSFRNIRIAEFAERKIPDLRKKE
jgi:Domain of Unknown Function (DUF1080)